MALSEREVGGLRRILELLDTYIEDGETSLELVRVGTRPTLPPDPTVLQAANRLVQLQGIRRQILEEFPELERSQTPTKETGHSPDVSDLVGP